MCSENVISCYSLYVRHSSELVSVIQSLYRIGQALRVPEVWGSQISRLSACEVGRVVSPTHRPHLPPPLTQEIFLVLISVRGRVDLRTIVRPEGFCQRKIVIELATFRVVAQCLDELRNSVPAVVNWWKCYLWQ